MEVGHLGSRFHRGGWAVSPPKVSTSGRSHHHRATLSKSSQSGRLAHAYLITGPEKIGKRTLAIDIACMVNSEPVVDMFGEAPNIDLASSQQADRIRRGIHSDVRVIDINTELEKDSRKAKSDDDETPARGRKNISIEHIRDLIKDSATKPFWTERHSWSGRESPGINLDPHRSRRAFSAQSVTVTG